jgi:hypothetical protein
MSPLLLDVIAVLATIIGFAVLIAFSEGCERL